ncbi:MAG: hypothetical protein JXR77_17015 [Lentisphaeria bacterium]|nr:hypothetical protein [Lentisphaeria bacterium]
MAVQALLPLSDADLPRLAIFLSGGGSNAERILSRAAAAASPPFRPVALVTDAPQTSRAGELGARFGLPVVALDIRRFYEERGEGRVSIATPRGQAIREEWTQALRARLAPHRVDFGVFAGFVPLTNLTADFPCLNVHPGDLTYLKDGKRHLVGLHTLPIERAILEGLDYLRSSVIRALPYTGRGEDMDNGPILGISGPVPIDLAGAELDALRREQAQRPGKRPRGGYGDRLEQLAAAHQERLKEHGDWTVFPAVVFDVARGRFGLDERDGLHYRIGAAWHPIETVVYDENGSREVLFRAGQ